MQRLIMEMPLMISAAIRQAADHHGKTEVVALAIEGAIHRCDHSTAHAREWEFAARPGSSHSAPDCCAGPTFAAAPP